MTWFGLERDNRSYHRYCPSTVPVFGQFRRADTSHDHFQLFMPGFGVVSKTGDAEPEDRGKPSRTICASSILVCRQQDGALVLGMTTTRPTMSS